MIASRAIAASSAGRHKVKRQELEQDDNSEECIREKTLKEKVLIFILGPRNRLTYVYILYIRLMSRFVILALTTSCIISSLALMLREHFRMTSITIQSSTRRFLQLLDGIYTYLCCVIIL